MSLLSSYWEKKGKRQAAALIAKTNAEGLILKVPALRTFRAQLPAELQAEFTAAVEAGIADLAERVGR